MNTTQQEIEKRKEFVSDIQLELVTFIRKLDLTKEQEIDLLIKISMLVGSSVVMGRLEHQLELESLSEEIIKQISK